MVSKRRYFKCLSAGCLGALLLSGWVAAYASSFAPTGVSRLVVAGDSLADVGTFGFKFTVQDAANPAGFPVFPELVAAAYGLSAACSHYMDNGAGGVMPRGDPGCTNFAVGGGRILHRGDGPQGIPAQLRDAAATVGGRFDPGDLVLMDGGGNDAADLATAYLAGVTSPAGTLAFLAFLAREVNVGALLFTAPGTTAWPAARISTWRKPRTRLPKRSWPTRWTVGRRAWR